MSNHQIIDKDNKHIGSSFDAFLKEEGIHDEVKAVAAKRVAAWSQEKLQAVNRINHQIARELGGQAACDALEAKRAALLKDLANE